MAKKIFLSPSNQTTNTYAYGNTNEAEQCGKIALAVQQALIRNGFEVKLEQYDTMQNRCAHSDSWGADLHVPIHTNGCNGEVCGTRMFCYSLTGEGYKATKAIFDVLAPITPGTSENIKVATDLYEVRVPKAPTAYIECEFHDVPKIAKWIIENTTTIAEAICKGICNYFGVKYISHDQPEPAPVTKLYRVQVGSFAVKQNAENYLNRLKADGYQGYIVEVDK